MNHLRNSNSYVWSLSYILGKGATGCVYQGLHKKTGEAVAVKSFNQASQLRPLEVQMREFEVMKVLSHENIVKMVAVEEEVQTKKRVLIMELCSGGSLFTILDDPRNSYGLEEEEFLCVLRDLSAGMKYLRDNSIIHRDLKPGNIMKFVTEENKSIYKLTDFGAARVLDNDEQFMSLYGTEEYLHPDMYERAVLHHPARKPFTANVDLWSIGATLYHVATGSLPFRPYGGRQNTETMHFITTKKDSGVISGVQHTENGPIEWSKELPKTCLLNQGLRDLVTNLLAGILECDSTLMWTFEQFFACVTDIFSRKLFHIFYMNDGKEICLYLQPNKKLEDLRDQIYSQTKVKNVDQLLLYNNGLFTTQIDPSADVSSFPSTSLDQPLMVVHLDSRNVRDLSSLRAMSACFPNFPSPPISTDSDSSLAKTCCSVAHAVKRLVVKLVRLRELLLRIPTILLSLSVEHVSKLCTNSEVLDLKMERVTQRSEMLNKIVSLIFEFVSLWSNQEMYKQDLLEFKERVSVQKGKIDELNQTVLSVLSAVNALNHRMCVSKELQTEWNKAISDCMNLSGCIERADTYVEKMRGSWQVFVRDRSMKVLNAHDNQFHMLERVKVSIICKKLLSLLQDQCFEACRQAFNKLDVWYGDMQATMVQCRSLDSHLISATDEEVEKFHAPLTKAEQEVFKMSKELIYFKSASNHVKELSDEVNLINLNEVSNGETDIDVRSYKKVKSQLQILMKEHSSLREIAKGNYDMIKELISLFGDVLLIDDAIHDDAEN